MGVLQPVWKKGAGQRQPEKGVALDVDNRALARGSGKPKRAGIGNAQEGIIGSILSKPERYGFWLHGFLEYSGKLGR
jgi:hypothetical protein